jgi:betaine-aldehyde dehydrogenase
VARSLSGESMTFPDSLIYTRREPLGVCVGIGAWNYPIQIACWKAAPALACGNTMIFKPSEMTPLSALKLAEILTEAGLPLGVFNVIQGSKDIVGAMIEHKNIAKVSLTGSVSTGKKVMAQTSSMLKHATMELGGKSPLIIFDDADIDDAVSGAMLGNFYSTGQICTNCTRVFVHKDIEKQFLERLVKRTKKIMIGDPLQDKIQMGPMVSAAQKKTVLSYIQKGIEEGAHVAYKGDIPEVPGCEEGYFIAPVIFSDVKDEMRICQEEIFGPVMSVLSFSDEDEVIKRANATAFGLASGVFTRDLARAHRVAAKLEAGICWINTYSLTPVEMPFGGIKESGVGRENGKAAVEYYTRLKSIYVNLGSVDSSY